MEAAKEAVTVISQLQERADPGLLNTLHRCCGNAVKFEVQPSKPRNAGKQSHCKNVTTDTPVMEEGDEATIHGPLAAGNEHLTVTSVSQDHYMAQYITPQQLVHLTQKMIVQLYEVFQDDISGDMHQLQNDVGHWKARCDMMNVAGRPDTLNDMIQETNPEFLTYTPTCSLQSPN